MAVSDAPNSPDVGLGSLDFWARPAEERDLQLAKLRREAPISQHEALEDLLQRRRVVGLPRAPATDAPRLQATQHAEDA